MLGIGVGRKEADRHRPIVAREQPRQQAFERGLSQPSLRTVQRISDAVGVPMYWLFEPPNGSDQGEGIVIRKGQGVRLTVAADGVAKTLVTPKSFGAMQLMLVEVEPGSKSSDEYYRHDGIDVGYVLEGSLNLEVDGRVYVLSVGDCFAFDSHLPHRFENRGGARAEILWVNTQDRLKGLEPD
ncbi:MAG: cupin domain-containing protein [Rhizobiales bacterium]|nr:cupin domain-containing protein [Hyphomicrobiales bacterium]